MFRQAMLNNCKDKWLAVLEKKLEKYEMVKQGMMQNLLTGKMYIMDGLNKLSYMISAY
ncbi:MAG: hypothetical protein SRB1_01860 [Desulfobacteraceae bacterium Eth-SRB1]|nr:MAG: hypothetical protein SRB1_01860 [Desulfobacteraceae bacterium Eth-SRB1]